jgi:Skp family chaperone for outer membrane proteins
MADQPSQEERVQQALEDAERRTAGAVEKVVQSNAFGELLARSTENVMGLTRIGFDTFDLVIRNLRLAGRKDVARLGTQLGRTEDKLERVLQEVENLRDELKRERSSNRSAASRSRSRSTSRSSNGSSNGRKSSSKGSSTSRSKSKSS